MKKNFLLTYCFVFALQSLHAQIINNAGFETGNFSGWTFTRPSTYGIKETGNITCNVIKDSSDTRNFVLFFNSTLVEQWGQLRQKIAYHSTDSLERLRISASVKWQGDANGGCSIGIMALGDGKDFGTLRKSIDKNTGWTDVVVERVIDKQTDSLLLFLSIAGTGKAYFDNIKIEKVAVGTSKNLPEAKAYLDTAVSVINRYALYRDSVDFNTLIRQAYLFAADAQKPLDCYDAIRFLLRGLNDRHSHFATPAEYHNDDVDTSSLPMATGKLIIHNIGYIKVPSFGYDDMSLQKKYADSMQHLIQTLDRKNIIGWIIDNRNNTGGHYSAMFLGLAPFLGEGMISRRLKNGTEIDSITYKNGVLRNKDSIIIQTDSPYTLYQPNPKVAVLINSMTASSGEYVAIAFKGRRDVKLFGEPSYGVSTLPYDYDMPDGALLTVFTSKMTDRLGNEYGGKVFPDESITDNPQTKKDEAIDAAVKWLTSKK